MKNIYILIQASVCLLLLQTFVVSAQENALGNPITAAGPDSVKAGIACGYTVAEAKEYFQPPADNFTRVLEGRVTGLQTTNGGGQPGSVADIMIRGNGTMNGETSPLIILDGAVYTGDLNAINVRDIQTIRILKDAAAGVQYGGRSANGVLEITTKTGNRRHKLQLDVEASAGLVTRGLSDYKVIDNPGDYYEFAWKPWRDFFWGGSTSLEEAGRIASGLVPSVERGVVDMLGYNPYDVPNNQLIDPVTGKINPSANLLYKDGNWKKTLQRAGVRHEYTMAVSEAGKTGDFRLSGGYLNENGYIKHTGYERFNGRFNGELHPFRWIKAGIFASGTTATQDIGPAAGITNPSYVSRFALPVYPAYYHNSDGSTVTDPNTGNTMLDSANKGAFAIKVNPLGSLQSETHQIKYATRTVTPYIEATLLQQLSFRMQFSYNDHKTNAADNTVFNYGQSIVEKNAGSFMTTHAWNPGLRWKKTMGKHTAEVQAGYEKFSSKMKYTDSTFSNVSTSRSSTHYINRLEQESYFVTGNYNFGDKYFMSGGYSRQASSQFAPEHQWNNYWAAGLGWQLSEEPFMKHISWLSVLKFRGSYGKQGAISPWFQGLSPAGGVPFYTVPGFNSGSQPGNPDLTAPYTNQLNIGTDIALFRDRLNVTADYFLKRSKDAFFYQDPAPTSGFSGSVTNGMDIQNKGLELSINAVITRNAKRTWDMTLNLTHYKNEITDIAQRWYTGANILEKGNSIYDIYLVESAGVNHENGSALYYYTNYQGKKSVTDDYQIAEDSGWVKMGSALPKLYGSLTNNISYGNFNLSFMLSFGLGGKYYDNTYWQLMDFDFFQTNVSSDMLQSWTLENKNSDIPRASILGGTYPTSRFLRNASYLNFRRLILSYDVPENKVKKMKLRSLQLYISGDNLWLIAGHRGMDPQATFTNNPDIYTYSPARTVLLGLRLGL